MKSVIFLAILALATALPNYSSSNKDIRIDDDRIIVSNGQGKRILIKKPTDEKTKQVEVIIAGKDGLTRKVSIDKNMHVVKDVHTNEDTTGLFKSHMVKLNSSNVTDNQFHTLMVIFKEYQGIINGVTYEHLLENLRQAVDNKKIHEVIYEALKTFDSDDEFNPMTGGGLGSQMLTQTSMGTYVSQPSMYNQRDSMMSGQEQPMFRQLEPSMYNQQKPFMFNEQQSYIKPNPFMTNEGQQSMFNEQSSMYNRQPYTQDQQPLYQQQYPMYNHQTFNWNQLSQQYGHNFVNQWSQQPYDSNSNNLEYHYQYAQEMYQTVKQTLEYLKQLEQALVSSGREDSQVQQELQQVQQLYNVVEQNLERIQRCKANPSCVTYFGKNWLALFGQQTTGQQNVYYGQPMNGQNVYGQPQGQNAFGQQQGIYGQQSNGNSQPMYSQMMVTGSQKQMNIEQLRKLRWQLMQKSQSSLQQFKMINQVLQQLVQSMNQKQNSMEQLVQEWQIIRYKLISLVPQETTIQNEILKIHEQMSNFAKQMIPGSLTVDQLTSTGQMQQQWSMPQQSQQLPVMQNSMQQQPQYMQNSMQQQPQYMSMQQQRMLQQQQIPTMQNSMTQQPQYTSMQQQVPTQQQWSTQQDQMPMQQQQPQQMPMLQNNMMMTRNKAQWPVSYNM